MRQFELNKYRAHFLPLKYLIENRKTKVNIHHLLSEFCSTHNCPIIAAYLFLAEMVGMTEEIEKKVEFLKNYYGYDEVIL